jgi:hypothetical protein
MVKTGDMSADRIKGGSIYLGDLSSAGMLANCEAVSFTETKSGSNTYYFDIGYSTTGAMGLFVCGTETYNFASDNAELTYKVERTSNGGRSYYTLSTGSLSKGIGRIPWRFDVTSQSASMWYRVTITETNSTNFGMVATVYKANTIVDQEGTITTNLVAKEGCQLGNLFVDTRINLIFNTAIRGRNMSGMYRMCYANHILTQMNGELFVSTYTFRLCKNN